MYASFMKSFLTLLCLTAMATIGLGAQAQETNQAKQDPTAAPLRQAQNATASSTLDEMAVGSRQVSDFGPQPDMEGRVTPPVLGISQHFQYVTYQCCRHESGEGDKSDNHPNRANRVSKTFPWLIYERPELSEDWFRFEPEKGAKTDQLFPAFTRMTKDFGTPFRQFSAENENPKNRGTLLLPGDYGPWPGEF
jgi:hypothetical protein